MLSHYLFRVYLDANSNQPLTMPGPRNRTQKRKVSIQKQKSRQNQSRKISTSSALTTSSGTSSEEELPNLPQVVAPLFAPQPRIASPNGLGEEAEEYLDQLKRFTEAFANLKIPIPEPVLPNAFPTTHLPVYTPTQPTKTQADYTSSHEFSLPTPCIHDPGSGPRIRNLTQFLQSPFAASPSLDVDDCRESYKRATELMDFLERMLPTEGALVRSLPFLISILKESQDPLLQSHARKQPNLSLL